MEERKSKELKGQRLEKKKRRREGKWGGNTDKNEPKTSQICTVVTVNLWYHVPTTKSIVSAAVNQDVSNN